MDTSSGNASCTRSLWRHSGIIYRYTWVPVILSDALGNVTDFYSARLITYRHVRCRVMFRQFNVRPLAIVVRYLGGYFGLFVGLMRPFGPQSSDLCSAAPWPAFCWTSKPPVSVRPFIFLDNLIVSILTLSGSRASWLERKGVHHNLSVTCRR